jgi:hypothetical protein
MRDYTTFETSLRLREAGFPQPEKEFGQVWYRVKNGEPVLVGQGLFHFDKTYEDLVFAPRITDLFLDIEKGSSEASYRNTRPWKFIEKAFDYYLTANAAGGFEVRWDREMELVAHGENIAEEFAKHHYLS